MSNPFTKVVHEYEELWPHIEKLVAALETINLDSEIVIPSKKCGDAYVTYTPKPTQLAIERDNKKYMFSITDV